MYNYSKKLTARLLLFSFLLESCYNPNMGMGKQALPTPAEPAYKQRQYAGEPYSKYPPKPTSHTFTTADNHPVRFTFHNEQWLAEVEEYAAHGSWQRRQLPVVFEPGLTLEDVVDSNPTEQKLLLHLCPSEEDLEKASYVYVGRAPIQAKPQLLSSPAARQTALQSEVGPIQQQATAQQQPKQPSNSAIHRKHQQAKQPQQAGTSPQQAQEQQRRQAVLALPSPVQQIGEGPKSQDQLPTTPARARSKALPATSRETPRQQVTQNQSTSAQRAPSRRALSWRNQHELLHSQRVAQAKREQSAAMAKPGNQLAQPGKPRQAIIPAPSLADKAPPGIASQNLLAQGGHPVRFMHQDGQWWASVRERIGEFYRVWVLPVACQGHGDVAKALAGLQQKPTEYTRSRIHVMHTKQIPYMPQFVYLGAQGLQGGGNGAGEASGIEEPQDEPAAAAQEARQALRAYYQHQDFALVPSLFEGEASKHVDSLQCQLMLIEQVKKKADREGQQTDLSTHHERQDRVKKPIALEDLFKRRSTKPDEPARAIQRVLLVGEPGTGKTTLSRKLAYRWAQGAWDQTFKAVYVLPVRALQQSQYDNAHMRREETLATAIANNCFAIPSSAGKEYELLRQQISEELKQPTTLVVLDGLDEGVGASESLLREAKAGSHKLLLVSRPYGIEQERTLIDIEIAHVGLSAGQMKDYVKGNLSPELGAELLSFIGEHPAIAKIAHVPVNLQILCALWQDNQTRVREETSNGSLPGLYRRLTEYIWERYVRERQVHNASCEELFDTLGKIALEALEQGEVFISPELVRDHVEVSRVREQLQAMQAAGFLLLQSVGSQYQFPHLTFQEYFAGRLLARSLLASDAPSQSRVRKFLTKHQYGPQYGRTLSFLAGEVSKEQGVEGISKLLHMLNEGHQEVVGMQHLLLQLRLLNEWLCVAGEDCEAALGDLEGDFHVMESLEAWFGEGLKRVRSGNDRNLLELLTSGLQSARSVAGHASAQVLKPLLAACKDSDADVRSAASNALVHLVQAAPEHASQVLESLIAVCKDSEYSIRIAARSALVQLAQAAPDKALDPLLAACKDSDSSVQRAASKALRKVAQATPDKALDPLLAACKDSSSSVRWAASSALVQLVQATPEQASQVLEPLIAACKDPESSVWWAARSALVQVAQAAPDKAGQALEPLIAACKDEDADVRSAASNALVQLVQAAPEHASQALKPLIAACKDSSSSVRWAASNALVQLVQAAPEHASQALKPLIAACKDSESLVRIAARSALVHLVQAAPEQASQVLEPLIAACKDEDDDVRWAASEALGKISLQQLIDTYWATQDQALIPLIAARLYHTPLSVQNIPNSEEQRLVLYPTAGQAVEWEKPQQEVQRFMKRIKNAAKQEQEQSQ